MQFSWFNGKKWSVTYATPQSRKKWSSMEQRVKEVTHQKLSSLGAKTSSEDGSYNFSHFKFTFGPFWSDSVGANV